jgi:hypothetical protein
MLTEEMGQWVELCSDSLEDREPQALQSWGTQRQRHGE